MNRILPILVTVVVFLPNICWAGTECTVPEPEKEPCPGWNCTLDECNSCVGQSDKKFSCCLDPEYATEGVCCKVYPQDVTQFDSDVWTTMGVVSIDVNSGETYDP
tara:strand:- start:30 stop:344 length:315 start_codon:yes stop_codon:yes gene_type:complete